MNARTYIQQETGLNSEIVNLVLNTYLEYTLFDLAINNKTSNILCDLSIVSGEISIEVSDQIKEFLQECPESAEDIKENIIEILENPNG